MIRQFHSYPILYAYIKTAKNAISYHSSQLGFTFHELERIFHAVERIFQPMECTFQPVEYKTQVTANRLSALIYCISNELQEHRAMNNLYEEA